MAFLFDDDTVAPTRAEAERDADPVLDVQLLAVTVDDLLARVEDMASTVLQSERASADDQADAQSNLNAARHCCRRVHEALERAHRAHAHAEEQAEGNEEYWPQIRASYRSELERILREARDAYRMVDPEQENSWGWSIAQVEQNCRTADTEE